MSDTSHGSSARASLFTCQKCPLNKWFFFAVTEIIYYVITALFMMIYIGRNENFLLNFTFMEPTYFYLKTIVSIINVVASLALLIAVLKDIGAFTAPQVVGCIVHTALHILICATLNWSTITDFLVEYIVFFCVLLYQVGECIMITLLVIYLKKKNYEENKLTHHEENKRNMRWVEYSKGGIHRYYMVKTRGVKGERTSLKAEKSFQRSFQKTSFVDSAGILRKGQKNNSPERPIMIASPKPSYHGNVDSRQQSSSFGTKREKPADQFKSVDNL